MSSSSARLADKRTAGQGIADWWLARVWPDLAFVVALTGVHYFLYTHWKFDHVNWAIQELAVDQRRFIYLGLATVSALVGGSNNTAVGSYVSSSGDVMKDIRVSHGPQCARACEATACGSGPSL